MLLLTIDRKQPIPLYQQIRDRIVELADEGTLLPGDRLPPTRTLSADLGVHRSTVIRAYDEIRALGYLEGRAGTYTTIRTRARNTVGKSGRAGASGLDWQQISTPAARDVHATTAIDSSPPPSGPIDMERLAPDPQLSPTVELRRCVRQVLLRQGRESLDYAPAAGHPPLREAIARRLAAHGVTTDPGEVLVTAGAQQAIDLVLRLLVSPGDRVALESPSYSMFHSLLRLHGVRPLNIPVGTDGLDLNQLEGALRQQPKLLYTMPNFQNPTGITTKAAHRERLLALCEQAGVPILEDGFEEEMKYFGRAVLPLKSMDSRGIVLYVGTFSKVVFPGLRLGWIAAPAPAIRRLTAIQRAASLSVNNLSQAAVAHFCSQGAYEVYLRRAHRSYRKRMQAMLDGLETHMPRDVRWTRPAGGYTLWLETQRPVDQEEPIRERLLRAGVRIAPGSRFFANPPETAGFRLSIACADASDITRGCRRLGRVLAA